MKTEKYKVKNLSPRLKEYINSILKQIDDEEIELENSLRLTTHQVERRRELTKERDDITTVMSKRIWLSYDPLSVEHIGDVEKTRIIRAGKFNLHYIVRKSKITDDVFIEVTDILRLRDDYKYITFKKNLYIL